MTVRIKDEVGEVKARIRAMSDREEGEDEVVVEDVEEDEAQAQSYISQIHSQSKMKNITLHQFKYFKYHPVVSNMLMHHLKMIFSFLIMDL